MATHASRLILVRGLQVVGAAGALFAASFLADGRPKLAPVASGLRAAAPWALFIGVLLLFLYVFVRKGAAPAPRKRAEPIDFVESTSLFQEPERRR